METYKGGCHCGRLKFEFATSRTLADLTPRACQCSFCLRHDAAVISDPNGLLTLITACSRCEAVGFRSKPIRFYTCPVCGVYVAATSRSVQGHHLGIVNIHALDQCHGLGAKPVPLDFAAEMSAGRTARRELTWTPTRISVLGADRQNSRKMR